MVVGPRPSGWIMKRRVSTGAAVETLLVEYFELNTSIRSEKTRGHYRRAVKWLEIAIGRTPKVADLTDDNVTRTLVWLTKERRQSAITANTTHKCLCSLWRFAHGRGYVRVTPLVRPLPQPATCPDSWSDEELQILLRVAAAYPYRLSGVAGAVWWKATLALELATLERSGALLAARWEWVDWRRNVVRVPADSRKGRLREEAYQLPAWAIDALAALRDQYASLPATILDCKPATYFKRWDKLLSAAGLPAGRRNKTHKLRRTLATLAVIAGRDPQRVLRHQTPGMAWKHYVDTSRTGEPVSGWLPNQIQTAISQTAPEGIS